MPVSHDVAVALQRLTAGCDDIATSWAAVSDENRLFEGEAEGLEGFTGLRRAQYSAGRRAARDALAQLGAEGLAIPSTGRGVPCFPTGFVGSISHKRHHAIAAVARAAVLAAIGVDLEELCETGEEELLARVCTGREWEGVSAARASGVVSPATWLHSVKEAVFKAAYTLDSIERDYQDIEVALASPSRFVVRRLAHLSAPKIAGHFAIEGNILVSLAVFRGSPPV